MQPRARLPSRPRPRYARPVTDHDIRTSYDTVAQAYAATNDRLSPLDRALLGVVAELATGPVADVGCGPGRSTAYLSGLGCEVFGVDLSSGMVEVARGLWPGVRFEVARMQDLPCPDAALGGIVAFWSIIHTERHELPRTFAEFARAVRADGPLLLAFQVGDEQVHIEHGYGHDVSIDAWRWQPERIVELLATAGFVHESTSIREPAHGEKTRQAYVLARRVEG